MWNTQNFLDNKSSTTRAPDKSNFASTCNLLTQFLKEKGNLKDLSRSINWNLDALGKSAVSQIAETSRKNPLNSFGDLNEPPIEETRAMDCLPQYSEDCTNKVTTSKKATSEGKSAQMTIFYNGKVWVFDSLPAEKAEELMVLVNNTSRAEKNNLVGAVASTSAEELMVLVNNTSRAEKNNLVGAVASTSTPPVQQLVSSSVIDKARVQSDANNSDLPIARRSSLNRFLEKRKERSSARAPYQIVDDAPGPSSKNDDQLELKL